MKSSSCPSLSFRLASGRPSVQLETNLPGVEASFSLPGQEELLIMHTISLDPRLIRLQLNARSAKKIGLGSRLAYHLLYILGWGGGAHFQLCCV